MSASASSAAAAATTSFGQRSSRAAFQDILELDCCNCNASDLWSKFDSPAIREVGASSCCRCKKLRSLMALIDP